MQQFENKIQVISLGVGDVNTLTHNALTAIKKADVVIGAKHHLVTVDSLLAEHAEQVLFPSPFKDLINTIKKFKDKSIAVLASGDALFFGVGKWLLENVGRDHLDFYPNVSSMQVAFHRVGIAWQDAVIHSLHGRPLSSLKKRLQNGLLIGLFSDDSSTPDVIANYLVEQGLSESELWVCESLGSDSEKLSYFKANDIQQKKYSPLTICIVKCAGKAECQNNAYSIPGIADESFETGAEPGKGMISKREVRLSILSLMGSQPNDIAWDIGAGCGSVSIEWALQSQNGTIYAIENNRQRMNYLEINNKQFATEQTVKPVFATAPECCASLPQPNVIFVGGNGGNLPALLDFAWASLKTGGRLVASAVIPDSIASLHAFADKHQQQAGELVQVQVNKSNSLSENRQLNVYKPVTLLKVVKGVNENE